MSTWLYGDWNKIKYGTYEGMTYKYNPRKKSLKFTSGKLNNSDIDNVPEMLMLATSIKFDNGVKISRHITDMSNMFSNDSDLRSLSLPKSFNTNSVKYMSDMFSGNHFLTYLHISSPKTKFNKQSGLNNKWENVETHHLVNLANGKSHHVGTWINANQPTFKQDIKKYKLHKHYKHHKRHQHRYYRRHKHN